MSKIGFIGAGKMARALIEGILRTGLAKPSEIIASDKCSKQEKKFRITNNNLEVVNKSEIIFITVRPQDIDEVLNEIKQHIKDRLIVSIAAGITLKYLSNKLGNKKIIRVMPNLLCTVGAMAAGYSCSEKITQKEKNEILNILQSNGLAYEVDDSQMDIVTALSGSGPGFFAFFIKYLTEEAIAQGLDKEVANKLIAQTVFGTGKLLLETNITSDELIVNVASAKGTTEAGLNVLKNEKTDITLKKVIQASIKRAKELRGEQ